MFAKKRLIKQGSISDFHTNWMRKETGRNIYRIFRRQVELRAIWLVCGKHSANFTITMHTIYERQIN